MPSEAERRELASQLAALLLPDLSSLPRAYARTGCDFLGADPHEAVARERGRLQSLLDQHTPDPETAQELERLKQHRADLMDTFRLCRSHPRFPTLLAGGYGTPAYKTAFWRLSYQLDRRAAAELCRKLKKAKFAEVLEEYHSARQCLEILDASVQKIRQPAVIDPVRVRAQLQHVEANLLQTYRVRLQLAVLRRPDWLSELPGPERDLVARIFPGESP